MTKMQKSLLAVGLVIASSGAFAQTVVTTKPVDVSKVYGRASGSPVQATYGKWAPAADSGRSADKGDTRIAVTTGHELIEFGRS
ncbi:MAG TPA: hypothetical protein VFV71_02590 [Burkholderiales bacterium]|nr:hypothetical protein [Burkholderiales bacterium]